jgi:hypothetical protein
MDFSNWIDQELVGSVKLGVATLTFVLLLVDLVLHRLGRPAQLRRLRDVLLALAGCVGALGWWELFRFEFESSRPNLRWVHFSDTFHYYVGPKYFRELGFTDLYACAAAAEVELGSGANVARRVYRELETNLPVEGRTLLRERCRERFEPQRWRLFVGDVDYFRQQVPRWRVTMQDWGYNATPVWTLGGALLAGHEPVTDAQIRILTLLDVPCLLVMWAFVAWSFGWRTLCVALAYWGSNLWNPYGWTGGSILRQEWLAAAVIGLCLLHRRRLVAAGAAITYSALLTIFPGFFAVGVGLKAIAHAWHERRLTLAREHQQLLLGAVLALVLVVPVATARAGGPSAWAAFVTNSQVDSGPGPNQMGLPTVLSYGPDTMRSSRLGDDPAPFQRWREARSETLARRRPWLFALVASLLAVLLAGVRRVPDWAAATLGVGLVVFAFRLTNYYYVMLVSFALLWPRHRSVGIALLAASLAGHALHARWVDPEEFFMRSSVVAAALVAFTTAVVCFAARRTTPGAEAPAATS